MAAEGTGWRVRHRVLVTGLGLALAGCAGRSDHDPPIPPPPPVAGFPAWQVEHWLNSPPLSLADLGGKVVLVRWWTGPACPYCLSSLPLLQAWQDQFQDQGLVVVGLYHHKGPGEADPHQVARMVEERSLAFPIAIDPHWRTLERWYLDDHQTSFTSISVLIGRDGLIRFVQERGDLVDGNAPARVLESELRLALAEVAPGERVVNEGNPP